MRHGYPDLEESLDRICRGDMFMKIAHLFGERSTCPRAQVGAIATVQGRIVASGYVGAPPKQPHCLQVGCELVDGSCVRTTHAEANLIAWAARIGVSLKDSTVYSTHAPCSSCAKLLVTAGIQYLIYDQSYWKHGLQLLEDLGVETLQYTPLERMNESTSQTPMGADSQS